MEIRDFPTLVNKCKLVEECNNKLKIAKSDAHRKRIVPETQDIKDTLPSKKHFQSNRHEGKQPQEPIVK